MTIWAENKFLNFSFEYLNLTLNLLSLIFPSEYDVENF